MPNQVKVPGGAFYAGDGLTVDQTTRTVSAGGGSSVSTPDWNQNDETASDYIKNRPFYTGDPAETVFVEENTVSFTDDGGAYVAELPSTFEATAGETYKVSFDGTAYECTCVDFNGNLFIGNLSIEGVGSDTGEPFIMYIFGDYIAIYTKDSSDSHTISVSGIVAPIVKIPAKYIDKNSSGYVVIHNKDTMTQQEAKNYGAAILRREAVFIIWYGICIKDIDFDSASNNLRLTTQNDEIYLIAKNDDGLVNLLDRKLNSAPFPNSIVTGDNVARIYASGKRISISLGSISPGVGSTDTLFNVAPNGTKSKSFEVLGNGEAVAPALILYSSTADSTKKFRITVDDSGTISATEVTA